MNSTTNLVQQAASEMMKAVGLPDDLQSLLTTFVSGPVPGKSYADMTPEERQKVREWLLEDPKAQEDRVMKQAEQMGFERAMRRERAFMEAFLGKGD